MSKNSKENENWKRNWLSISSEKSIYNNKIPYKNEMLEPDICRVGVVANFISSTEDLKKVIDETNKYTELGYKVFWVVNLIDDYAKSNFIILNEDDDCLLFENRNNFNNILNGLITVLNKCNVYFEIDDEHPLYKLKKNTHECYFCVEKKDSTSRLNFISDNIFGYKTIYKEM